MTRQDYSEKESLNRIVRIFQGNSVPQDVPNTVPGEMLSENTALSDITELLGDSLPGESLTLPTSIRNAIGNAGFFRGWGGGYNIFVDQNHANASDANSGFDANYPLSTITQAITNARAMSGDTIFVLQNDGWTYGSGLGNNIVENVIVPADKPGLQILGVCPGSMGVNWSPTGTASFALTIYAIDTRIDGFNLWGDGDGIYAWWDGSTHYGENLVINNVTFSEGLDTAIQLEYVWYPIIANCHFDALDAYGIAVSTSGSGIAFAQIYDNWFHECAQAMALGDADDCKIKRNDIYNSTAQATGTATNMGIDTSLGSSNIVADNNFSCLLANWDTFNSSSPTDAWINNHTMDGLATTSPT